MELFLRIFSKDHVEILLADREFIGRKWISFLEENGISYAIRLKENGQYISNSRGKMIKIKALLHCLNKGEKVHLGLRKIGKEKERYHISAARNSEGSLIVLMHSGTCKTPIDAYAKRWDIETMFKAFKSNGFNLEETHITDPDRLDTLLSVMVITFCIAYQTGHITAKEKPIRIIKSLAQPVVSIFRYGINRLQNIAANIYEKLPEAVLLIREIFYENKPL
jgi:hypothetical protein